MLHIKTQVRTQTQIIGAVLAKFERALTGSVIRPDDPHYDAVRAVWNGKTDTYPALIVQCHTTQDVQRTFNFVRKNGVLFAGRGGGHGVAETTACNDGLVIDLSAMCHTERNPE